MSEEQISAAQEYGADQIQILEGLEAVRKRPGMYIGSTSSKGLHHLVYEIVDNAVDEAVAGYGKNITVTIHKDGSLSVKDEGRGIPYDYNAKEKKDGFDIIFCTLHGGGKFSDKNYKNYFLGISENGLKFVYHSVVSQDSV